jgi:hypothetical protein
LLVRRIRELLYEQGFTINGARNRLDENERLPRAHARPNGNGNGKHAESMDFASVRTEIEAIRKLLRGE